MVNLRVRQVRGALPERLGAAVSSAQSGRCSDRWRLGDYGSSAARRRSRCRLACPVRCSEPQAAPRLARHWNGWPVGSSHGADRLIADLDLRQIDGGLALVRGVVTDPKQPVVEHQTSITRVTSGRKRDGLGKRGSVRVNPAQRCSGAAIIKTNRSQKTILAQGDHLRPADACSKVAPFPFLVRRAGIAKHRAGGPLVPPK